MKHTTLSTAVILAATVTLLCGCPQTPDNATWHIGGSADNNKVTYTIQAAGDNLGAAFIGLDGAQPEILETSMVGVFATFDNGQTSEQSRALTVGQNIVLKIDVPDGATVASGKPFLVYQAKRYWYNPVVWESSLSQDGDGYVVDVIGGTGPGPGPNTTQHLLTLTANPVNGGTVIGGGMYNHGATAVATAVANPGFYFGGWSNGVATASQTVVMNMAQSLSANFLPQGTGTGNWTLAVNVSPAGTATVSITPQKGTYNTGEVVTITAAPFAGKMIDRWAGSPVDGLRSTVASVTMNAHVNLTVFTTDTTNTGTSPVISLQPNGGQLTNGSFTLSAAASPATQQQWYRDGGIITGATGTSYTANQTGTFFCRFYNGPLYTDTRSVVVSLPGTLPPVPADIPDAPWTDETGFQHFDPRFAERVYNWDFPLPANKKLIWGYGDGKLQGNWWGTRPASDESILEYEVVYHGADQDMTRKASGAELAYQADGNLLYGNLALATKMPDGTWVVNANERGDWCNMEDLMGVAPYMIYDGTTDPATLGMIVSAAGN